jgi:ribonuclease R
MNQKRKTPRFSPRPKKKSEEFEGDRRRERWPDHLLALIHQSAQAIPMRLAAERLGQLGCSGKEFEASLDSLFQQGFLRKSGKGLLTLHRSAPLYEGLLQQHPKGFGFVSQLTQGGKSVSLPRDPYVSPAAMGTARHGDRVLLRVLRIRRDQRPEAVVVTVTVPGSNRIAGVVVKERGGLQVTPDDQRNPFTIRLEEGGAITANAGDAVIVEITRSPRPSPVQYGTIVENLGSFDSIGAQFRLVVERFDLPQAFPDEVEAETATLSPADGLQPGREDLRTTAHITIDGDSAKDFDDAICVEKLRNGYRLYVSIADVAHYVVPGSAIDREAYARGTSIYFPGRVIPMLPERLSNDLCSLVEDEDRPTLTAILDFDRAGNLRKKRFCRSLIRSRKRFTYDDVAKILIDHDPDLRQLHRSLLTPLKWAAELARALQQQRQQRGSLDFNLLEAEFALDDSGEVSNIKKIERNFAHQMIEEFMLAANQAVASLATERHRAILFRVHEQPDPEKSEEFFTFATSLGLSLPQPEQNPAWYAGALEMARGSRHEYLIHNLLLRSMKQAQYRPDNVGHFGLAAPLYTHFTSPIRRYPDLLVHRALLAVLENRQEDQHNQVFDSLDEAGSFLSARERTAIQAERDMEERLKLRFMRDRVGEKFSAIVSGVSDTALFLVIPEHCLSGSIAVDRLGSDYFLLDAKNHRLFGEISGKVYRIGDPLGVTLESVDILGRRLNFIPDETPQPVSTR